MNDFKKVYGLLAQFNSPLALYHACEKTQKEGFTKWDAYSPFPIHGLQKVMNIPQSKLPWMVGLISFICGVGGYLSWTWMNAVDYKFVIAGKPFYSWPAYFLPGFECAMLSAGATCLIGMVILNKTYFYHPLYKVPMFSRATDDKFFISIEATDPKFDIEQTQDFLKKIGAVEIAKMEE